MIGPFAWRRQDVAEGLALGWMVPRPDGIEARGQEIVAHSGGSWWVDFRVDLDSAWRTRTVVVRVTQPIGQREVRLEADGEGRWRIDGVPARELDGCLDVDVAAAPLTNTFPIRRLALGVGESADVAAAWVGVPDLGVERLDQRYTRLDPDGDLERYEYHSVPSGRSWILLVDGEGVVVDYQGFARQVFP